MLWWAYLQRRPYVNRHQYYAAFQSASKTFSTDSESEALETLVKGITRRGRLFPRIVRCTLPPGQALQRFQEWQSTHWLAPSGLLKDPARFTLQGTFLPFWLFEAQVLTEFTAQVGRSRGDASGAYSWEQLPWRVEAAHTHAWTQMHMQVYASYKYRRDLAKAAQFEGALGASRALTPRQAAEYRQFAGGSVANLDPVAVKQAIAWDFAMRNMREVETLRMQEQLQQQLGPERVVRDVRVRLKVLSRRSRLLYLPAYVLDYQYGEVKNEFSERRAEEFQAIIGGAGDASVCGERHFCPHKSRAAAASSVGVLGAAVAALAYPFLGADVFHSVFGVDLLFYMLLGSIGAGFVAGLVPRKRRQLQDAKRLQDEMAEYERIKGGFGPQQMWDDELEEARCLAEWRRWEESDAFNWQQERRQLWAEKLWKEQRQRKILRMRFRMQQELGAAKQKAEAEREARRRARYGASWHEEHTDSDYWRNTASGGGRRDWLGYYKLLGLSKEDVLSTADVKDAFRKAALKWHPDRLGTTDEAQLARARQRFQQIVEAYNTLRDPQLKQHYDSGRL